MVFGLEVNGNHEVEEFAYATRSWLGSNMLPQGGSSSSNYHAVEVKIKG